MVWKNAVALPAGAHPGMLSANRPAQTASVTGKRSVDPCGPVELHDQHYADAAAPLETNQTTVITFAPQPVLRLRPDEPRPRAA